jgi:hypothetical protein
MKNDPKGGFNVGSASFALDGLDVKHDFTAQHWDVMEAVVRDPDGRDVSLQAPLPDRS